MNNLENKDKLDLINTTEDLLETAGGLLEKGHEIVDTLSEYSPYVRLANNLMNKRREHKCKNFLQGLAIKIFTREDVTSDDLKKLNGLLEKNVNRILILDILEEAIKTVSDVSAKLLGIIAGQVMEGHRTFNYNDWILINGLRNMNDWDIENFKRLYSHFDKFPKSGGVNTKTLLENIDTEEFKQIKGYSSEELEKWIQKEEKRILESEEYKMLRSSLMRINSFQILSLGPVIYDKDSITFERNPVGDELYELIKINSCLL